MIDDRVKAYAFDGYSFLKSDDDFIGDVGKPFGPPIIFDPRFRNENRLTVTRIKITEQFVQRAISRIRSLYKFTAEYPLIVYVIIGADDVQIIRMPTELRPRWPESISNASNWARVYPAAVWRCSSLASGSVTTFINGSTLHETRVRIDVSNRIHGRDACAYQLALQLQSATCCKRVQDAMIPSAPGEEGDLVHRREVRKFICLVENKRCEGSGKSGKTLHELRPKNINIVGPSVVAQIPYHLRSGILRSMNHGQHAGPVVMKRSVSIRCHRMPSRAF